MLDGLTWIRLSPDHQIKPFNCGDSDLNDFLLTNSHIFAQGLVAVTYIIENENKTIAFFSVLNDKISAEDFDSNRKFRNIIQDNFALCKRFKSYPAVKIGRFGIDCEFQKQGLGTEILDYIKVLFVTENKTGCVFLTVDAYRQALEFYERNDFKYLNERDKNEDTRLMYFDLTLV
jgi:GNAT superfamily N-acetyltransferase